MKLITKVPVHLEFNLHVPRLINPQRGPLVFLHGLFGSKQNYNLAGKKLCERLESPVYALDLRNHGESPHALPFDYPSMAKDVEFFLEEHTLKSVTIIGHSMGAKVAMSTALLRPDLVNKLVSVDNVPKSQPLGLNFKQDLKGMAELELNNNIEKTDKKFREKAMAFLSDYEPNYKVRVFLASNFVKKLPKNCYNSEFHQDKFAHFRVPVIPMMQNNLIDAIGDFPQFEDKMFNKQALFLKAKHSDFVKKEHLGDIYSHFPKAEIKVFDTGHWLVSEALSEFVDVVEEFVREGE